MNCPECHVEPLPAPIDTFPALRCYSCGIAWMKRQAEKHPSIDGFMRKERPRAATLPPC